MKYLVFIMVLLSAEFVCSQSGGFKEPCVSGDLMKRQMVENPEVKLRLDDFEKEIHRESASRARFSIPSPGSITIPVVIYVVHDGTSLINISDAQVNNQIAALNSYFVNTGMKFCLATKANTGTTIPTVNSSDVQTTPGIIHVNNAALSNHFSSAQQPLVNTAHSLVTKDRYLRIWVVKSIDGTSSGILGYSMFPNTSSVFDGIVMRSDVFGNGDGNLLTNYNLGKVLVHEVGHYLALYHTFEGGCASTVADCDSEGDRVCDTPPVAVPNFGCVAGTDSCTETPNTPDDLSNYMDYGNHHCQNHFTVGQIERMLTVLSSVRSTLYSSDNILYTGTCGSDNLLSATITPSDYSPCTSASVPVSFSALPAQSYSWDFGDPLATALNPNTSTTQNPSHIFTSSAHSPYRVTLTVTDGNGRTARSTELIYVTDCAPIANANSYWYVDTSSGLDFSTGRPVFDPAFPNNRFANVSCNSQCDSSGNLLFYTNKFKVWNNQHVQINTTDLMLNQFGNTSNQVLIVPKPPLTGNVISQYYIFTQQPYNANTTDIGFRYNIVNVSGTNATMGVIKQPVTLPVSYGFDLASDGSLLGLGCLSAVRKCNSNEYWILTLLKRGNVPYLVVFSLTSSGLIYNSEQQIVNGTEFIYSGNIEIAPNGNKILLRQISGALAHLYDFNKANGIVSNTFTTISIPQTTTTYGQIQGCSFSPDSNLLYATDYYYKKIYQFNINTIGINNSIREVASTSDGPWAMQLGPDNKLYTTMAISTNNYGKLSVIHNPNIIATAENPNACNFSVNGPVPTSYTYRVGPSLPNNIDAKQETAYFAPNTPNVICKYITACNTYKFFPNVCGTSFIWVFTNTTTGSFFTTTETNPIYNFAQNGTYIVTLKDSNNVLLGTSLPIEITTASVPSILGSTTACLTQPTMNVTNNSVVVEAGETVQWTITGGSGTITGPNNLSSVNVNWNALPGVITLTMVKANGCTSVSTKTITATCPNLSNETFYTDGLKIVPNPSTGLFSISFPQFIGKMNVQVFDMRGRLVFKAIDSDFNKEKTIDLSSQQSGVYILKIAAGEFNYSQKIIKN